MVRIRTLGVFPRKSVDSRHHPGASIPIWHQLHPRVAQTFRSATCVERFQVRLACWACSPSPIVQPPVDWMGPCSVPSFGGWHQPARKHGHVWPPAFHVDAGRRRGALPL